VLTIATLGSIKKEQQLDGLGIEETKHFIHHYNFPPFSVGEVKMMRGASRRDIGHGALAERAILPVLPGKEEFPYTIRIVSDILESNGSSSMASVCSASLSLFTKASNLTNRGIVDWGPYRYIRHPGYLGKNMFWLMTLIPVLVPDKKFPGFSWPLFLLYCASIIWGFIGWSTIRSSYVGSQRPGSRYKAGGESASRTYLNERRQCGDLATLLSRPLYPDP
jgi:hypothetical protein